MADKGTLDSRIEELSIKLNETMLETDINNPKYLENTINLILTSVKDILNFNCVEFMLFRNLDGSIPKVGEIGTDPRKKTDMRLHWITGIGYDEGYIKDSTNKTWDINHMPRGPPLSVFNPKFNFENLFFYDNIEYIKKLENEGKVIKLFYEKMKKVYEIEEDPANFPIGGFAEFFYQIYVPVTRSIPEGKEIIGLISIDTPLDIPLNEPPSKEKMESVMRMVKLAQLPIMNAAMVYELKTTNNKLESTLTELKEAQAELVNEQRMAGIGTLASGVAHEINNPASAILSKSETLKKLMSESIDSVCEFLMFESKEKEIYSSLLKEIVSYALNKPPLSTREVRNLKNSFRTVFEQINENLADELAMDYSEMYFSDEQLNRIVPLLKKYGAEKLTKFTQLFFDMAKTASFNLNAAQDIVNVTNALKGSARIGEYGLMNIRKGLEDTLLIYKTTLINAGLDFEKDITRKYADFPTTFGYEAELRQVWRNLIDNAIKAMEERKAKEPEYQPKLAIETSQKDDYISVRIQDNGGGIAEEVQKRIFEPLITTREQGKGTGLGLYIIKKNVDKHDGKINWQSQPGNTVFEVLLPIVSEAKK